MSPEAMHSVPMLRLPLSILKCALDLLLAKEARLADHIHWEEVGADCDGCPCNEFTYRLSGSKDACERHFYRLVSG